MGLLEQISQMKKDGLSNEEISLMLQERGNSPKDINDAFNQEKIKNAVYSEEPEIDSQDDFSMKNPQVPVLPQRTFYQPKTQEEEEQKYYTPKTPAYNTQKYPEQYSQQYQEYLENPQEEYYPTEQYGEEYSEAYSTDMIIEIAEQVFSEKIKKIENQIERFNEFVNLAETKITNNSERIKRIESIIDKLQIAIIEKIGNYGKSIESVKKEMEMIEDSFSKIIPKLQKKELNSKK